MDAANGNDGWVPPWMRFRYVEWAQVVLANRFMMWLALRLNILSTETRLLHLLEASQSNREDLCQLLLDSGSDQSTVNQNTGLTPLLIACMAGSVDAVSVLAQDENGIRKSLLQCDGKMRSPLYHACKGGHVKCVVRLLQCSKILGMEKDVLGAVDNMGHTPLHAACLAVNSRTVEVLLSNEVKVNAIGRDGCTPIMLLTRTRPGRTKTLSEKRAEYLEKESQRKEIASMLLKRGARVDLRDCFGAGLIHLACGGCGCQISHAILEVTRDFDACLLQKHLQDIDNDGMGPLHILFQKAGTLDSCEEDGTGFISVCRFLIQEGIDLNQTDYGMTTPIMQLAWGASNAISIKLAEIVLDSQKCDPTYEHEGWSVLHILFWNQEGKTELYETFERFMVEHHSNYMATFDAKKPRCNDMGSFLLQQKRLGVNNQFSREERRSLLQGNHNVKGIAKYMSETLKAKGKCKVVVLTGAGISVSCGIPDFRSPESGIYSSDKYKNAFNRDTLLSNPSEIWTVARDMLGGVLSGETKPSLAHCFIKLLHEKGMLVRNFTQNVDTLESKVGIPSNKIIEAHGSFSRAICMSCGHKTTTDVFHDQTLGGACQVPQCAICKGIYRPDVVLFGEPIPVEFFEISVKEIKEADVLIVMGTSLKVYPFASLVNQVSPLTPRLLINRTYSGPFERLQSLKESCVKPMIASHDEEQKQPASQLKKAQLAEANSSRSRFSFFHNIFGASHPATRERPDPTVSTDELPKAPSNAQSVQPAALRTVGIEDTSSYRDAAYIGNCDDGVRELAHHLGWEQDLLDTHFNL